MVLSSGTRVIVRLVYITYNNAHVTELRCVIIGNFGFSNPHQSAEAKMDSF